MHLRYSKPSDSNMLPMDAQTMVSVEDNGVGRVSAFGFSSR